MPVKLKPYSTLEAGQLLTIVEEWWLHLLDEKSRADVDLHNPGFFFGSALTPQQGDSAEDA